MANIMMTDACNLRCPYCFANEFVNKDRNEITEDNFDKAVQFIVGDGSHTSVGLIGGEPTIHSQFEYFLRKLIANEKVQRITVYTNGICLDKYVDIISHPKVYLLINCNCPSDIGESNFAKLCQNLDHLLMQRMMEEQITLGINMYSSNFEYEYFVDLLKKYHCKKARVSITVPNTSNGRNIDAHGYFSSMKPRLFEFFHELLGNGIIPNFDCNKIPSCLLTKEDVDQFAKYMKNEFVRKNIGRSNIANPVVRCSPVIDIRQDLTAVRCFGLSEYTKTKITDFHCISELQNYYMRTVDAYAYNTVYSEKCIACRGRNVTECMGGCLAFKIDDIVKMQKFAASLQDAHRAVE